MSSSQEEPIVVVPYQRVIEADIYNANGKRIFESVHICVIGEASENPSLILPVNRAFAGSSSSSGSV